MRVGIDTRFYSSSPTGIGRYTYELCLQLLNYEDLKLVLFLDKDSPLLTDEKFDKVEKFIIKEKKFGLLGLFTLAKKIEDSDLDLYHSPSFIMPFVKSVKTIITIHDLIHLKMPEEYGIFHKLYYNLVVKRACFSAEYVITVSEASKHDLVKWLGAERISKKTKVIYNAVAKKFSPHIGMIDVFNKFEIDRTNFILYVGNNRANKNLLNLLKAYAKAKKHNPDFPHLVLTCDHNQELFEFIHENVLLDDVKFIGSVSDDELVLLYSYCLFFVFPSLFEGFGIPVLEAMSCGCPVACSNIKPLKEILGESALFFNPLDPKSIQANIEELFYNKNFRESLREKSLAQVKNFSWEKTAKETYELYKAILVEKSDD